MLPVAAIVPAELLPPAIPFTLHVTPVAGLPEPLTAAMNTCVLPAGTVAEPGATLTAMSSCSATLAVALAVESATLVALTLTAPPAGRIAGAVYSPLPEIVPAVAFPPATPFTAQVTPVFELPVTLAANCCVCPRNAVALPGWIVTVIVGGGGGGGEFRPLVPAHAPSANVAASATSATAFTGGGKSGRALWGAPSGAT